MKREYTIHHYMWYVAIALTIIMAVCKLNFWYAPIVIYFVAEVSMIVILAIFKGKVKQLPKLAKKAAEMSKPKQKR